jgi:hypothetical protein
VSSRQAEGGVGVTVFVLDENALNAGGPTALSLDRKPHESAESVSRSFVLAMDGFARESATLDWRSGRWCSPRRKAGFFHFVLRGLCGDSVLSGIGCRENAFAQLPGPLCFDGAPAKLTGELARPVSVTNDDDVGLLAELVSELL